ncbi:hypothetical protein GGTG_13231 [Gaeumannomyces tritici R3-111a-1]|uniref:Uncharacterized protein n=1 Tax=Gaeumannomyces tritici (strain R3-111a-1) TaxID=644352 RepID=J3PIA3_GAET3|nr:hypothetical protein GGTG_13231 [Gaeumannomyces tritici R3-111a-1]EJT69121.1 hypothetical protein GGTG_13231 [Gaeumannomyces tritici R3-111a-1]
MRARRHLVFTLPSTLARWCPRTGTHAFQGPSFFCVAHTCRQPTVSSVGNASLRDHEQGEPARPACAANVTAHGLECGSLIAGPAKITTGISGILNLS